MHANFDLDVFMRGCDENSEEINPNAHPDLAQSWFVWVKYVSRFRTIEMVVWLQKYYYTYMFAAGLLLLLFLLLVAILPIRGKEKEA